MFSLFLALLCSSTAEAGPWVHEPGKLYARVGYGLFTAGSAFDDQFQRAPMADDRFLSHMGGVFSKGRFTGHSVSAYAEVGVLPHVEVFGSLPVSFVGNKWTFEQGQAPPIQQKNAGLGDAMIGLRGGYTGGAFAGSLGTSVTLPLYNNDPEVLNMGTGNSDFYDDIVPLGQGTIDVHIDLALGVSLHPVPMWLALNSGVRVRNRQYATVLPGAFQVGYKPVEEVALMLNTEWSAALKNGEQPKFYFDEYGKGPTIIDGQSSVKLGLAGMVDVWKTLAVEASVSAPVVGQRTAAGIGVGVGVSYRN